MASIKLKGDTSGEVTISAPSVAGTTTLELPATSSTLATQNSLGVRNLIINGDMRIAQRGDITGITSNSYGGPDRFRLGINAAGTWTMSQDTDVPSGQGFSNSAKLSCTTADASLGVGDFILYNQRIEGQNLQHLKKGTANAESLTISFWIKSNKTGTYNFELNDADNTRHITYKFTINTADTWEKKTVTFNGDTVGTLNNDNENSLQIYWWLAAGSNYTSGTTQTAWVSTTSANRAVDNVNLADSTSNYINITGVQLEVGTEATPFEHRPYDMELARCQRYYQLHDGMVAANGNESTSVYPSIAFKTEMRATPSLSQSGVISFVRPSVAVYTQSSVSVTLNSGSSTGARLRLQNLSGLATNQIYIQNTNGAYVTLDAEL